MSSFFDTHTERMHFEHHAQRLTLVVPESTTLRNIRPMPRPAYNWAYETTDPETLHADIQAAADDNQSAYAFNRIRRGLEVLSDPSFTQLVGDLAVRRTEIDDGTGNWADLYALVIEERAARTPNE